MKKSVLITGGSRGIGKDMVRKFAAAGYNVAFTYSQTNPSQFLKEFAACDVTVMAYKCNLAFENEVLGVIEEVISDFGKIDVLINNAGVFTDEKMIMDTTTEEFDYIFNVNVKGTYLCTREIAKHMIENRYGRIINISSILGRNGASCNFIYSGSKAAIIGFTKALSKEVGDFGITVNCIAPGCINTDMMSVFSEEELREIKEASSVKRLGEVSDISNAALFLVSESAGFITGTTLNVDGGYLI